MISAKRRDWRALGSAALGRLREPDARELFRWCLPALIVAFVLRAVITWTLPYGHCYIDTPDFLLTAERLLFQHHFVLHSKKTFLAPCFLALPFLVHLPALIVIPLLQHLFGLGLVFLTGCLCRLWFARWKWFIVPLTLAIAAEPAIVWYEQTLMAETLYLFCTVLLAFAGTLYTLQRSLARFVFLCVALVLEAGARPEGKLLIGFAFLLMLLLHARTWRRDFRRMLALLVLAIGLHFITKTGQGGVLLYTSLARFTPSDLKVAPGFDPYIAPVRANLQHLWSEGPFFPHVSDRRLIEDAVARYLKDHPQPGSAEAHHLVNDFCVKLAAETCRRNALLMPGYALAKFRASASDSPSGAFDQQWLINHQYRAYADATGRMARLSVGLTGHQVNSDEDFRRFVDAHFHEVPWFNAWEAGWFAAVDALRLPDTKYWLTRAGVTFPLVVRGIPIYFLLALLGLLSAMFRRGALQPFHIAWGLALIGFFFVIMLTANVKPRFRAVFEPFWWIYVALLLDSLALAFAACAARLKRPSAPPAIAPGILPADRTPH